MFNEGSNKDKTKLKMYRTSPPRQRVCLWEGLVFKPKINHFKCFGSIPNKFEMIIWNEYIFEMIFTL